MSHLVVPGLTKELQKRKGQGKTFLTFFAEIFSKKKQGTVLEITYFSIKHPNWNKQNRKYYASPQKSD